MKVVYLVETIGWYSGDVRLSAIFDTREKAEDYTDHFKDQLDDNDQEYFNIAEWEVQ